MENAIREELEFLKTETLRKNLEMAKTAFEGMEADGGCVTEGEGVSAIGYEPPEWVALPFEDARISAPVIHAGLTSVEVKTGL
ncbi:MAG: hypothetical protein GTN53_26570, partial [Candidatus Aminicenantes bacterium]|nr:hypothetical protein [Candidatus Aminicenantes bacterium]